MCGIIAVSNDEPIDFQDLKLGMLLIEDRGGHSTGLTLGRGGKTYKCTSGVEGFFEAFKEDDGEFLKEFTINTFIGHTRFATKGGKKLQNIHPFNFPTALGVHNGTIENFNNLVKDFGKDALRKYKKQNADGFIQDMKKIESDSLLLYYMIDTFGLEDTLKQLRGSMALVWYDENNNMHVYRYDKPLCYGKRNGEIWISSLKKYLEILQCNDIKQFTEHAHFIIKDGVIKKGEELANKFKPKKKKSKYEDVDEGFEEDKCKIECEGEEKNEVENEVKGSVNRKLFKLPVSAKHGLTENDKLAFYTFSNTDYDIVYLDVIDIDDVLRYDLSKQVRVDQLKKDFPNMYEMIDEDYQNIKEGNFLREEHENHAV